MDYKQTEVGGSAWHRFSNIAIENPRPGIPHITCKEDVVIALTSGEISRQVDSLRFPFNPAEAFAILDPNTNDPIPGATAMGIDVYVLVYSYVLHEARKRDEALAATGEGNVVF